MFLTGVRSANALTERALRRRSAAWVVAIAGACAPVALGASKDWNNASGGDWQEGANWTPTGAPGAGDDANFNLGSAGGYSLTFSSAASANGLTVHTDRPTLLLGGTQALALSGPIAVGATAGDVAELNLSGGGTLLASGAVSHIIGGAGASGAMSISGAGTVWKLQNDLGIQIGTGDAGASGTLSVTGGGHVSATGGIIVANDGGSGQLNLSGAQVVGGSGGVLVGHSRLVVEGEDQGPSNGYLGVAAGTTNSLDAATIGSAGGTGLAEISGTLSLSSFDIGRGHLVVGPDALGSQGDVSLLTAGTTLNSQSVTIGSDGGTGNLIQYDGTWTNSGSVHVGADSLGSAGSGTMSILKGSVNIAGTLKVWNTPGTSVTVQAVTPDFTSPNLTVGTLINDAVVTVAGGTVNAGNIDGIGMLSVSGSGSAAGTVTGNRVRQDMLQIGDKGRVITRANGGPEGVSHLKGLSIDPNGLLDLNDNDLVVEYNGASPFTQIKAWVLLGYRGVIDPDARGIVSTVAQQMSGNRMLALFDNALVGASDFNGQTLTANSVVGKYTYFGDANFDGQVTGDDYTIIDSNLNTTPPVGMEWLSGDVNLDGIVTGDDYTTIDSNLGLGTSDPLIYPSRLGAAVPEPAGLLIGVIGIAMSLGTRRRGK